MTILLLVSACGVLAVFVIGSVIPVLARETAVCRLHDLRELLYRLVEWSPDVRERYFYRDLEFILASSIHVAREKGVADSLAIASALQRRQGTHPTPLTNLYANEIDESFSATDKIRTVELIERVLNGVERALLWRAFWANPITSVFLIIAAVAVMIVRRKRSTSGIVDRTASGASTARDVRAPEADGLRIALTNWTQAA